MLLTGPPATAVLALERDAAGRAPTTRCGVPPSVAAVSLRDALDRLRTPGASFPPSGALARAPCPATSASRKRTERPRPHAAAALLKPAEKRALDLLSDWPWLALDDLAGLLGVSASRGPPSSSTPWKGSAW